MLLLDFLKKWREWVDQDIPHTGKYSRSFGLCMNAVCHTDHCSIQVKSNILTELRDALAEDYGVNLYPFGGEDVFDSEQEAGTAHKNELRLAWVDRKIKELENAV